MTDKLIREIVSKIQDSLKTYDLKVDISIVKNNEFGFKIDVTGVEVAKLQELENKNKILSIRYGFTQNIVGMEFENTRGDKVTTHKIVGFKTKYWKYPVITTDFSTGNNYKFSIEQIKNKLGGDNQINRTANLDKLLE